MRDDYTLVLEESCKGLERTYNLLRKENEREVLDLPIKAFIKSINKELEGLSPDEVQQRTFDAFNHMTILAHMMARMDFFEYLRVDFRGFPNQGELEKALLSFVSRDQISPKSRKRVNDVVEALEVVDKKFVDMRFELPYRMLRIFIVMTLYSDYVECGVLASFLVKQLKRSG